MIRKILILLGVIASALVLIVTRELKSDADPDQQMMQPAGQLDPSKWSDNSLTIANLGHATLLMDWFGTRIISDPTLFDRVGFSVDSLFTIGPRRHTAPPLDAAQLQNVGVILITHAHMDHLDLPSLRAMPKNATVVACSDCGSLIRPLGFSDVRELGWGEQTEIQGIKITAMGARHWGARWPPWGRSYGFNSYVIERGGVRMLLACDSAFTPMFGSLASSPPDVAAFSSGAYDPWIYNHANPEQVWTMFQQTGARYLIPIHWGTFRLSKEPMDEPMRRLLAAAGPQADRIVIRQIGAAWTLPQSRRESASSAAESEARANRR